MAITEFLERHQVFTSAEFHDRFGRSVTDRNLLSRAVTSGRVDRVKRGLYVSKTGPYTFVQPDPFQIAVKVADDVVLCRLSALSLYGVAHNITFRTQFYTGHTITAFTYANHEYQPLPAPKTAPVWRGVLTPGGQRWPVTTREQTLIDCLSAVRSAGGPEHVIRSVTSFRRLDLDTIITLVGHRSASVRARVGWLLEAQTEAWSVDEYILSDLAASLGSGPYYFGMSGHTDNRTWVNRWKLYLPCPADEVNRWLNQ